MKSAVVWFVVVIALGGCQQKDADPRAEKQAAVPGGKPMRARPATPAYAKDVEALCDVVARSGAPDDDSRTLLIANWLAANLRTPESREFLVEIQPLVGDEKANALEAEAKRVGIGGCALAAEWRTPT